jgi:RimJ/RimL family protein N-acetyltransferase
MSGAAIRLLDLVRRPVRMRLLAAGAPAIPAPPTASVVKCEGYVDAALKALMTDARHWDENEMNLRRRLGDACYLVMDGPRCVHYSWVSRRRLYVGELGFSADLPPGDLWVYNAYTSPDYRGHAIFPAVLGAVLEDLPSGGVAWAGVLDENAASRRALAKAGFIEVLTLERGARFFRSHHGVRVLDPLLAARFNEMFFHWSSSSGAMELFHAA